MAVCIDERKPEAVCRVIEQSRANLLPTSPTFLNLLIASKCYTYFNLSSLINLYQKALFRNNTCRDILTIPNYCYWDECRCISKGF